LLIIKNALPEVARQKMVRSVLTRIDVDRVTNRYDIYIEGEKGLSFDLIKTFGHEYLNVRVLDRHGVAASFQLDTSLFEKIVIL